MNQKVIVEGVSYEEAKPYIEYLEKKHNMPVKYLKIEFDGEYATLWYQFFSVPFERVRRITGYLVGTIEKWNDAKKAEERDRVKHL